MSILIAGETCGAVVEAPRAGLLVDGRDFYRAVYQALGQAERSILMAGWQFDGIVELLRGDDADGAPGPCDFVGYLRYLCETKPELEIDILAWDASAVFSFERMPLQRLVFERRGHERIHYRMDNCHPPGGSHHQKLIAVDRSIAFIGGMDVCSSRWDDREHRAVQPLRCSRKRPYAPYHDVQAFVTGDAVDVLRGWFIDRWKLATHSELASEVPRRSIDIDATLEVSAPAVGLTRTWPEMDGCPIQATRELKELHLRAIAAAERMIYVENQYFSCDEIERAMVERMEARRGDTPLEIAIVLPEKSAGMKERLSIGVYQAKILRSLTDTAARTGHRVGVYYSAVQGPEGDVPVFIHAKVMAVDDRFLLVSSANFTNRSMSYDSELGLAWEAPVESPSIRAARIDLMREHVGLPAEAAEAALGPIPGLVDRLNAMAGAGHRLRIHRRNQDERPGKFLSWFIPDDPPFDPDHIEDMLPEPGVWLDRMLRDPLVMFGHGGRQLFRRTRRRLSRKSRHARGRSG
ncbi:MAG TPA: phospholipase D-like domain-containing protein [Kofleriaceae bacterium]|nr:phospholipase D-like domain-containing protein [Kofleriaceae bacterium]